MSFTIEIIMSLHLTLNISQFHPMEIIGIQKFTKDCDLGSIECVNLWNIIDSK